MLRTLSCLVLLDISWKIGLVNSYFFPAKANVCLHLPNVCCMVEKKKKIEKVTISTLVLWVFFKFIYFLFYFSPGKGCKTVLGKSYSPEQLKIITVKILLTEK